MKYIKSAIHNTLAFFWHHLGKMLERTKKWDLTP